MCYHLEIGLVYNVYNIYSVAECILLEVFEIKCYSSVLCYENSLQYIWDELNYSYMFTFIVSHCI